MFLYFFQSGDPCDVKPAFVLQVYLSRPGFCCHIRISTILRNGAAVPQRQRSVHISHHWNYGKSLLRPIQQLLEWTVCHGICTTLHTLLHEPQNVFQNQGKVVFCPSTIKCTVYTNLWKALLRLLKEYLHVNLTKMYNPHQRNLANCSKKVFSIFFFLMKGKFLLCML